MRERKRERERERERERMCLTITISTIHVITGVRPQYLYLQSILLHD